MIIQLLLFLIFAALGAIFIAVLHLADHIGRLRFSISIIPRANGATEITDESKA